jgi:predicted DNA-binding ribbon-helix-helix protein
MATSAGLTQKQLVSRLHEQTLDVANLRTALDVQMNRIAHTFAADDKPGRRVYQSLTRPRGPGIRQGVSSFQKGGA